MKDSTLKMTLIGSIVLIVAGLVMNRKPKPAVIVNVEIDGDEEDDEDILEEAGEEESGPMDLGDLGDEIRASVENELDETEHEESIPEDPKVCFQFEEEHMEGMVRTIEYLKEAQSRAKNENRIRDYAKSIELMEKVVTAYNNSRAE